MRPDYCTILQGRESMTVHPLHRDSSSALGCGLLGRPFVKVRFEMKPVGNEHLHVLDGGRNVSQVPRVSCVDLEVSGRTEGAMVRRGKRPYSIMGDGLDTRELVCRSCRNGAKGRVERRARLARPVTLKASRTVRKRSRKTRVSSLVAAG
jgi:hypothetical protein